MLEELDVDGSELKATLERWRDIYWQAGEIHAALEPDTLAAIEAAAVDLDNGLPPHLALLPADTISDIQQLIDVLLRLVDSQFRKCDRTPGVHVYRPAGRHAT